MAFSDRPPPPYNPFIQNAFAPRPFASVHNPADGQALARLRQHVSGVGMPIAVERFDPYAMSESRALAPYGDEPSGFDLSMRRTYFRLGPLELSFESAKRLAPHRRMLQPYGVQRISRGPSLVQRLMGYVGFFATLVFVVIGALTLWTMRPSTDVGAQSNNWAIADAASGTPAKPAMPLSVAATGKERQPSTVSAPRLSFAPVQLALPSEKAGETERGDVSSSSRLEMVDTPLDGRPLDQIPAVRDAIRRALATGDMQQWDYGTLTGVVVVGPLLGSGEGNCRKGTILARNGGFTGRTQLFERCANP